MQGGVERGVQGGARRGVQEGVERGVHDAQTQASCHGGLIGWVEYVCLMGAVHK